MKAIDHEIRETELRLAWRRRQIDHAAHELGTVTLRRLSSPGALAAAAFAGFVAGGLVMRRRRHAPAAAAVTKSSVAGLVLTSAMALLRSRYANPQALLGLYRKYKALHDKSPRGDSLKAQAR